MVQDVTKTYRKALLLINSFVVRFSREASGSKHNTTSLVARVNSHTGKALQTGKQAKEHKAGWAGPFFLASLKARELRKKRR